MPTQDQELLARIAEGEEAAFTELVQLHHASMVRIAMLYVSSASVAQEVVQETWLAVLKGIDRFEGRSALKTWIFRILTNRAKTRGQREGRSLPFSALGKEDQEPAVDPARFNSKGRWADPPSTWEVTTPEAVMERGQAMEALQAALEELPPQQQAVVRLRDVEGWDSQDVCNVLDVSETNQRVLLHRGRSKLRKTLAEHMARTGR